MTAQPDVKSLREVLGVTQAELAAMLGVHPITVSRWERGVAGPPPYNYAQVAFLLEGACQMQLLERERFRHLLNTGKAIKAFAFVVSTFERHLAVEEAGPRVTRSVRPEISFDDDEEG